MGQQKINYRYRQAGAAGGLAQVSGLHTGGHKESLNPGRL